MAVTIKDKTTGYYVGKTTITSVEELRKLERDYIVISIKPKKEGK